MVATWRPISMRIVTWRPLSLNKNWLWVVTNRWLCIMNGHDLACQNTLYSKCHNWNFRHNKNRTPQKLKNAVSKSNWISSKLNLLFYTQKLKSSPLLHIVQTQKLFLKENYVFIVVPAYFFFFQDTMIESSQYDATTAALGLRLSGSSWWVKG